ncbi:MAG: helix-turn-helix domain-containing protein [bacterium]
MDEDKVLTTKQAAQYLQTSLTTIFKMIREGELKARKVGRGYRFLRSELEKFLRGDGEVPHR